MSDLMLDVDQTGELKAAFRRGGWTNKEIKWLCEGDVLERVRKVLLGHASIQVIKHPHDCDADPFVPIGWKVEEHQRGGAFKWDALQEQVQLHLDKDQQNGKHIEGNKLREQLAGKPVLNANVLDYLLKNLRLIPDDWKKDHRGYTHNIFFWGTIYRHSCGSLYVRYLFWSSGRWSWDARTLNDDWYGDNPAAVRAS